MKLGYDLTIEQTQKLVMTPELIQAIQILQFNAQELDTYVEEQLLTNPVLETAERSEPEGDKPKEDQKEDPLAEYIKERVLMISAIVKATIPRKTKAILTNSMLLPR